jgi:hypothetical protein
MAWKSKTVQEADIIPRLMELADRFWSKVDRRGSDDCWPWISKSKTHFGYGSFGVHLPGQEAGRLVNSHRCAYILSYGAIPSGMIIRHSCDNPACCNPRHLVVGTFGDNMRDMRARGRGGDRRVFGVINGRSKLTVEQVREIRQAEGKQRDIAKRYGISPAQVWRIKTGTHWRDV